MLTEVEARVDGTPAVHAPVAAAPRPARPGGQWTRPVEPRLAAIVGVAGVALTVVANILYPQPAEPVATPALWVAALETVYWAAAFAGGLGLVQRQRYGLVGAAVNASALGVAVVACPVTGHHTFGVWWLAQATCALAFLGVAAAALRLDGARARA